MELRGLENKKVFYKFTGNFLEIKKGKKYAAPEYTQLELERLYRVFPTLLEKVDMTVEIPTETVEIPTTPEIVTKATVKKGK
mgnify:FL=1